MRGSRSHPNHAEEAEALLPILYTFCIHHVGPITSSWFQPGAEAINFGYTWDSENGVTFICVADKKCEQLLDFGSEMLEDVAIGDPTKFELTGKDGKSFSLRFLIDLDNDPRVNLAGVPLVPSELLQLVVLTPNQPIRDEWMNLRFPHPIRHQKLPTPQRTLFRLHPQRIQQNL
jgi:hypothetical protein